VLTTSEVAAWIFFQLAFILIAVRAVGYLARYLGQPQVVGEMIAGVVIGPSVLGALSPELQGWLFPKQSLPILYVLAQIGLVLYMFLVGLEFDRSLFRAHARGALSVSMFGIAAPFALGAIFAVLTYRAGGLFTAEVSLLQAALFVGAAMSITAFPMLARIIKERGLAGSSVGVLALAAGAADDAAAWCILALVLAIFQGKLSIALFAVVGGALYGGVVLGILMPLLARREQWLVRVAQARGGLLSATLILLSLGAWFTDFVGIYAVFGAFILGVAMPRTCSGEMIRRDIEPLASNLLLPLFFVYSGLNTRMSLLLNPQICAYTLVVVVLACCGKGVACAYAARRSGQTARDSLMIGALMNARGLMELILLNIGLERGLITPTLFTMMVMMAIVTTLLASPVFSALYRTHSARPVAQPASPIAELRKVS
jgi:Kef-type K+ transport system membrane component KefB